MITELNQLAEKCAGIVVIAIWVLILILLTFLPIAGYYLEGKEEVFAYFAIGLLFSAILIDVSMILSLKSSRKTQGISKKIWFSYCVIITLISMFTGRSELFVYAMTLVSFPLGLINAFILGEFYMSMATHISTTFFEFLFLLFFYASFIILGYVQWFKLLPFFIKTPRLNLVR